jgi:nucleoside-diphosphate-sugar epimerase
VIPLEGRRITILGGAGFIGHHLALDLSERGADVSVVDSLQINNMVAIATNERYRPHRDLYARIVGERLDLLREAGIHVTIQDARDYHALARILTDLDPQVIVQAAAVAHAGESNKNPFATFDHSLRTLENALDCARSTDANCEQFIFLSSSMVYGNFLTPEVDEDHPLNSIGIYGALKVAGEKIVVAYQQVFGLDYTIVRPSALYGPRCVSRRVGQVFIENALEGKPLQIAGDGGERLDFTYIDDLVQGIRLTITEPAARNQIFNLTHGGSRSIAEVAAIVREHFPGVDVKHADRDALMPERGTLSIEKARRLLSYDPENPIEVGFPKYIDWYRGLFALGETRDTELLA